jgi:hypothetical protein
MNCPNCNTPIDDEMQACLKCGAAMTPVVLKKSKMHVSRFNVYLFVGVFLIPGLLCLLEGFLFPVISNAMLHSNAAAVAARGRDIYIAITGANTEREPLKKTWLWPKTPLPEETANQKMDAFSKGFKTSTDYFKALLDEEHYGTDTWKPAIPGFDYTKLVGGGVQPCTGRCLTAVNNIWVIAADATDTDNDRIPLLLTRNVDVKAIERVVNQGLTSRDFNIRIDLGKGEYRMPFANKMIVFVRMGGGALTLGSRHATLGELFDNKELPPRDPSKPPIVYLMP